MAILARILTPFLLATAIAAQGAGAADVPPIQEDGEFYILNFSKSADDAINLEEFINICEEATGRRFTYEETTRQQLTGRKVFVHGLQRVPKADFYAYFQILMFINEFVCVEVGPPHISVILIQSLTGNARAGNLKQKTIHVLPEQLEDYADQPATLITTVLNLPNTDARQLSTSLRGLLTDTNTQTLIAAGENSVILQGFGSYIASLAKLLYIVDEASAGADQLQPVFEVLPLEYAAGETVADLIDQLLEARSRRGRRGAAAVQQQGVSGALATEEVEARILVDARTNSLLVMALPEEMPRIKDLVARLDVDVIEPERNFHVYSLQNVSADEVADVLDEFLSNAERISRTQGGTGGRQGSGQATTPSGQTNEVIVVPDEASNSLLIAANKTRYEEVLELIRQLDRRQDQVLIETALIELTGTDFRDIGFEWALADTNGEGGFGVTNFGLSTFDLGDNGEDSIRVPLINEGITAGILSGDDVNLPFLIAATQRVDGANVLNVPSVLVNNNGSARVRTLDEQPTTTVTAQGGVGGQTQENFRDFEEAGITMEISPSISASRYLRLNITLQVSTFTGSFGGSTIPPPRTTRELSTTVNVPDGDTMVIGGIITDNLTETTQSVPFLGDIPILKHLFRRSSKTNTRTTPYFFVTPHILRDRDFADLAEISYRKKLDAAEVIGRKRVQLVDPNFGGEGDTIDFEGFQVPLYRSPARGEVDPESIGLSPERRAELLGNAAKNAADGEGN